VNAFTLSCFIPAQRRDNTQQQYVASRHLHAVLLHKIQRGPALHLEARVLGPADAEKFAGNPLKLLFTRQRANRDAAQTLS
jgi:hypothetical protein